MSRLFVSGSRTLSSLPQSKVHSTLKKDWYCYQPLSSPEHYNALFGDYSPEELDVSVFVSTGGLPVGLRLGAPSYSEELSGLGVPCAVEPVLAAGFFWSAVSFLVSTSRSLLCNVTEAGSLLQ
jgi:hypothetical protein